MNNYRMGTKCVQAGYKPGNGEPRQIPIIQSTTFKYDTSEDMGKLFDLEAEGYFYSRLQNPTCDHVAAKIAAMEGGTAATVSYTHLDVYKRQLRYQKEICRTANSECSMPAHKLRFQYPVIFQNFLEPLF